MAEDPQPLTLQQRIAALNAAHIGRVPGEAPRPSPQVPGRRPVITKQKSINNPPEQLNGSICDSRVGNQPNGPPPLPFRKQPPPLPTRKPSQVIEKQVNEAARRPSDNGTTLEGITRTISNDLNVRLKAPAWGETNLPVLPPKGSCNAQRRPSSDRPKYVTRAPSSTTLVASSTITTLSNGHTTPPERPSLPPRLPSRKTDVIQNNRRDESAIPKIPSIPSADSVETIKKSILSMGFKNSQSNQQIPQEELALNDTDSASTPHPPPPVPLSSRPSLASIQATKPKFSSSTSAVNGNTFQHSTHCMTCRDFSSPDRQASLFPRTQVNSLQMLAQQLTSPFPSLTDKARAIFTWLHYNIAYDVENFFRGTIRGSTPNSTLQSGLAVCEGYAALFTNLATYAGLESVVIGGHGKGYGYHPLAPGSPLPPYSAGHAWNAVKIDNDEWKLIDACWGAGHVQGAGMPYVQEFNPDYFTMSNEQFGIKHFPESKDHFFLPGGRRMSWEEYIQIDPAHWPDMVEGPTIYTNAKQDYGIGEKTVLPRSRKIAVNQGGIVRFQFGLLCPHWTLDKHTKKGLPPVFIVSTNGRDNRNKDNIPMEHVRSNGQGGDLWYVDIPAIELGTPGQMVTLFAVNSFGNRQDARGLTVQEFRDGKGRVGMGFVGVAAWDLV